MKLKVNETRKRSLLKGVTHRVVEVAIDTVAFIGLFEILQPITPPKALLLAILIEGICFATHYLNERVWNRIDYGRGIK